MVTAAARASNTGQVSSLAAGDDAVDSNRGTAGSSSGSSSQHGAAGASSSRAAQQQQQAAGSAMTPGPSIKAEAVADRAPHAAELLPANGAGSSTPASAGTLSCRTATASPSRTHVHNNKQQELQRAADAVAPPAAAAAAAQGGNPGMLSLQLHDGASLPLQPPARSTAAREAGTYRSSSAGGIAAALAGGAAVCRQGAGLQDNRMAAVDDDGAAGSAAADDAPGEVELLPWSPEGPLLRWDRLLQSR